MNEPLGEGWRRDERDLHGPKAGVEINDGLEWDENRSAD